MAKILEGKHILLTKFGGQVSVCEGESYSSNSYMTDWSFLNWLVDNGAKLHIFGDIMKRKSLPAVLNKDDPNREPWHDGIVYHPDWPYDVPEYIDFILIQSGSENLRFRHVSCISKNLLIYRLLRAKKPTLVICCEAYTPFFPFPQSLCDEGALFGATLPEILEGGLTILHGGQKPEAIRDMWYAEFSDIENFVISMDGDYHIGLKRFLERKERPILTEEQLMEPCGLPLSFVGADRRRGSREALLYSLSKSLNENFFIRVVGNWDKHGNTTNMFFDGKVSGVDNILDAYQQSYASLVLGNKAFADVRQMANRIFETVYAGTLPLFDREWKPAFAYLFEGNEDVLDYLTIDPSNINEVLTRIHRDGTRTELIEKIRKIYADKLSDRFITTGYRKILGSWIHAGVDRDEALKRSVTVLTRKQHFESVSKRTGPTKALKNLKWRSSNLLPNKEVLELQHSEEFLATCFSISDLTEDQRKELLPKIGRDYEASAK